MIDRRDDYASGFIGEPGLPRRRTNLTVADLEKVSCTKKLAGRFLSLVPL